MTGPVQCSRSGSKYAKVGPWKFGFGTQLVFGVPANVSVTCVDIEPATSWFVSRSKRNVEET